MIKVVEIDQRFYMKESTLPGAGLGLFAKHPLKKGGFLEIIGVLVQRGSPADACTAYSNNYKFGVKYGDEIWHLVPMGWAAIINAANTKDQQNCAIQNIRAKVPNKKIKENKNYLSYCGEAVYSFLRDIDKDEELIGDYGHEWKKSQQWVDKFNKVYDENTNDWNEFMDYGLYHIPYLKERIMLEE